MQKAAIIFGATGQDGSYLSEYLISLGYRVVGVTRRCSVDNRVNLKGVLEHPCYKLLEGDVSDYLSVSGCFNEASIFLGGYPSEVYNLSAQSHVGLSFQQPTAAFRINAEGTLNILSFIKKECGLGTRFYQASTSEMFGNSPGPQDENTPFAPNSPYAIAKLAAHHTVRMYREAYGQYACCGILFNHESPRRGETFVTRKITKYIAELFSFNGLLSNFPKLELGNLDACRDWGYAGDYVKAMHLMLQQSYPEDYVIGTGTTHTIKDFLKSAFGQINLDYEKYVVINPDFFRPSEVDYLLANPAKAKSKLGWTIDVDFDALVLMMVQGDIKLCRTRL